MIRKGGNRFSEKIMLHENQFAIKFTDRSETMSLKRFTRAGLVALAGAMLLGIALSVPTFHSSYAQAPAATAPAPDAAAPAAPPADAGPPACDGVKVTENCTPNSGDTAWMLTSMAIVLMMTIPGLALFYGGMVRKKNV